jgi:hypothetical protein
MIWSYFKKTWRLHQKTFRSDKHFCQTSRIQNQHKKNQQFFYIHQ